jgi:hypothetical protein
VGCATHWFPKKKEKAYLIISLFLIAAEVPIKGKISMDQDQDPSFQDQDQDPSFQDQDQDQDPSFQDQDQDPSFQDQDQDPSMPLE